MLSFSRLRSLTVGACGVIAVAAAAACAAAETDRIVLALPASPGNLTPSQFLYQCL